MGGGCFFLDEEGEGNWDCLFMVVAGELEIGFPFSERETEKIQF